LYMMLVVVLVNLWYNLTTMNEVALLVVVVI